MAPYNTIVQAVQDIFPENHIVIGKTQEKILHKVVRDLFKGYEIIYNAKKDGGIEYHFNVRITICLSFLKYTRIF